MRIIFGAAWLGLVLSALGQEVPEAVASIDLKVIYEAKEGMSLLGGDFDDEGRLFALSDDRTEIYQLEDTNGDGVFESVGIVAGDLKEATGMLCLMGSLFVLASDGLWEIEVEEESAIFEPLIADWSLERKSWMCGPYLHPNGRIYFGLGGYGPDKESGIWSCRPDGSDFRLMKKLGDGQVLKGLVFAAEGELLGLLNKKGEGGDEWFLAHLIEGDEFKVERVFGFQRLKNLEYSSLAISRQGSELLLADLKSGSISQLSWKSKGSSYAAGKPRIFGAISDAKEGISSFASDATGSLIAFSPAKIFRLNGAENRDAGIEWESSSSEEIASLLGNDRRGIRERATTELAVRGEQALPELETVILSPDSSVTAKQAAVWTLSRLRFSDAVDLIAKSLSDQNTKVVQTACNALSATRAWQIIRENEPDEAVIEFERNDQIGEVLARLVLSGDPAVARSAAATLGAMADPNAVSVLLRIAGRRNSDPTLVQTAIQSLIEIEDPDETRVGLQSDNVGQQFAALVALDAMPEVELEPLEVIDRLDSENKLIRTVALEIAGRHLDWDAALVNRFLEWEKPNRIQKSVMNALIPKFRHLEPMQRVELELRKRLTE